MLRILKGFLTLKDESFEYVFDSDEIFPLCLVLLFLSCISGSLHPFLVESNNIIFTFSEFITKFIGLLSQNLFIISGIYFIGVTFLANNQRVGITADNEIINDNKLNLLNIRRMFQLLGFSQIPVLIGMVSTIPGISGIPSLVFFIMALSTIWLYALITKSVYIGYGFKFDINTSKQVRYIKSILIVLFTYVPSVLIFQLFISGLIYNLIV